MSIFGDNGRNIPQTLKLNIIKYFVMSLIFLKKWHYNREILNNVAYKENFSFLVLSCYFHILSSKSQEDEINLLLAEIKMFSWDHSVVVSLSQDNSINFLKIMW